MGEIHAPISELHQPHCTARPVPWGNATGGTRACPGRALGTAGPAMAGCKIPLLSALSVPGPRLLRQGSPSPSLNKGWQNKGWRFLVFTTLQQEKGLNGALS